MKKEYHTKTVYCYNCNNPQSVTTEGFIWHKACTYCKTVGTLRNKRTWGSLE